MLSRTHLRGFRWVPGYYSALLRGLWTSVGRLGYEMRGQCSYPRHIHFETTNHCSLRCPLCVLVTNRETFAGKRTSMSSTRLRQALVDWKRISIVDLFNNGEPFLDPELFQSVRFVKQHDILVRLHSHFSLVRPESFFESMIRSGLDLLVLSVDGGSQSTYSRYRQGGDFRRVMANIDTLLETKRRLGRTNPVLYWQLLANRHNEAEISAVRRFCFKKRIWFHVKPMVICDNSTLFDEAAFQRQARQRSQQWLPLHGNRHILRTYRTGGLPMSDAGCRFLFSEPAVDVHGHLFPCCYLYDPRHSFGNVFEDSLESIWNGNQYRFSRSLFGFRPYHGPYVDSPCTDCVVFRRRPGSPTGSPSLRGSRC